MGNRGKIESILKKYGWIEKSKIGENTVQHTDLNFIETYFPQFKKLTERGEANPRQCATMQDRILMWKGKKQIYGTQASNLLRPDKRYAIWPIENPRDVNEIRFKSGFNTTVEENAALLKAEYDPSEKLPTAQN
ncbi:MAG: DUF6624 domain-containing protein [Chryseolinea sp.]